MFRIPFFFLAASTTAHAPWAERLKHWWRQHHDVCPQPPDALDRAESAAFQLITSQARIVSQTSRRWCFSTDVASETASNFTGRAYNFTAWASSTVELLNLIRATQLTPCPELLAPLVALLAEALELGIAPDSADQGPSGLGWWELLLSTAADAFSCGFDPEHALAVKPDQLPPDIRQNYHRSILLRKVWRLTREYLEPTAEDRSWQKSREKPQRFADFAVSLYVPFLPADLVPLAPKFLGETGPSSGHMRTGIPVYQGPAVWSTWHNLAERILQLEETCEGLQIGPFIDAFKSMLGNFAVSHPCPYCREHFMSQVSRNDARWRELKYDGDAHVDFFSEAELYPLEYLFSGGAGGIGSISEKFSAVVDGKTLSPFVWKLHNAVSSSVEYSIECKTEEIFDADTLFRCNRTGAPITTYGPASTASMGRVWPFAMRYQFSLREHGAWSRARNDPRLREAIEALNALDGPDVRTAYWTAGSESSRNVAKGEAVVAAAAALDRAVLASGILKSEFGLQALPHCGAAKASADRLSDATSSEHVVPPTLEADGNFPFIPAYCLAESTLDQRKATPECGLEGN